MRIDPRDLTPMGEPEVAVYLEDSCLIELLIVASPNGPSRDQMLCLRTTLDGDPLSCVRDQPVIDPPIQSNPRRHADPGDEG